MRAYGLTMKTVDMWEKVDLIWAMKLCIGQREAVAIAALRSLPKEGAAELTREPERRTRTTDLRDTLRPVRASEPSLSSRHLVKARSDRGALSVLCGGAQCREDLSCP